MNRLIAILFLISLFSCKKQVDRRFLITSHQVGVLNDSTAVYQLDRLFAKDSIVARLEEGDFVEAINDSYYIYTKTGKLRLIAIAKTQGDSTSSFKKVIIFDSNYKTLKGLNKSSYYLDLKRDSAIYKIKTLVDRNVLLTFDTMPLNMLYDKKSLAAGWENSASANAQSVLKDSLQASSFFVVWE